ncbi:MAG TPA: radical SAM protein [Nitrospirota bacterium]|nr:radical SAM protein [Nitrospirota bacterium]
MNDQNSLLFTKEEREMIRKYSSEIASKLKRLLRNHYNAIEKSEDVIEGFFNHPRILQIETIAACNAKCIMCPTPGIKRERRIMDDWLFKKIIDDCIELKPRMIWPFLNGEPFLDPKIFSRIEYIEKTLPGQQLGIFTNASLLNEDKIRRLFDYHNIKWLHISINAASKETYERIMSLNYKRLLQNMEFILKYNKNTFIEVSFVVIDENKHEIEKFNKLWKDSVGNVEFRGLGNWAGKLDINIEGYGNHANKLIRKIIDIMVPPLPCTWQIMNMFILSNGKVCHCCGDSEGEFIVGDVKRMNLTNIWKSNLNKSLRYKHLYGTHIRDIEICKRCIRSPVKL